MDTDIEVKFLVIRIFKFITGFLIVWISATLFCAVNDRSLGIHKWLTTLIIELFNWLASAGTTPQVELESADVVETANADIDFQLEKHAFKIHDVLPFVQHCVDRITEDEITKRFASEQLEVWNLLTRNGRNVRLTSARLKCAWVLGFLIRYLLLLPCRLFYIAVTLAFVAGTLFCQLVILPLFVRPENLDMKRMRLSEITYPTVFRLVARGISLVVDRSGYPNFENAKCIVANHTTPLDVVILSTNGVYSLVGQRQGGLFGMMQRCLSAMASEGTHIWFDRQNPSERHHVLDAMTDITHRKKGHPILIFPEGTCINNTSLMMFRRGAFTLDVPIQPVAIRNGTPTLFTLIFERSIWGLHFQVTRDTSSYRVDNDPVSSPVSFSPVMPLISLVFNLIPQENITNMYKSEACDLVKPLKLLEAP